MTGVKKTLCTKTTTAAAAATTAFTSAAAVMNTLKRDASINGTGSKRRHQLKVYSNLTESQMYL